MSNESICKYSEKVLLDDNIGEVNTGKFYHIKEMKYIENERKSADEKLKSDFIGRIKRTLREWPVCTNGGSVNIVFEQNKAYFKCNKCLQKPEDNLQLAKDIGKEIKNPTEDPEIKAILTCISYGKIYGDGDFEIDFGFFRHNPKITEVLYSYFRAPYSNVVSCKLKEEYFYKACHMIEKRRDIEKDGRPQ